jgi:hypothetical protein
LTLVQNSPFAPVKSKSSELIPTCDSPSSIGGGCNLGERLARLRKYKTQYRQDIEEQSITLSSTSSKSRSKSNSKGRSRHKQSQTNLPTTDVTINTNAFYIGYEFECPSGHRYFVSKDDLPSSKVNFFCDVILKKIIDLFLC